MKKNASTWMGLSLTALFSLSLLAGCSQPTATTSQTPDNGHVGTVLLSINPEIRMDYDEAGRVVALTGVNDDGEQVLSNFQNAQGKPCQEVLPALVHSIGQAGYFDDNINSFC